MPLSKEEQFEKWFENSDYSELAEALTDKAQSRADEEFQESSSYTRSYTRALDDFIENHFVENCSIEDFEESAYLSEEPMDDDPEAE